MAIPKTFSVMFVDWKNDITKGDVVEIVDEFRNQEPKFKAFLTGTIKLSNGETRLLGMNKSSYKNIAIKYGKDTATWVGASIKYIGEQKLGNMMGRVFEAI